MRSWVEVPLGAPMTTHCKYCGEDLMHLKGYQKGAHIVNCSKNPKREEITKKSAKSISEKNIEKWGEYLDFLVKCSFCGNGFYINEREKKFDPNKKRYCSTSCGNRSRKHSKETKLKISKSISSKYNKLDYNLCKSCGKKTNTAKSHYCKECFKYNRKKNFYENVLRIKTHGNLIDEHEKTLDILKKEYIDNNLSGSQISTKYNISHTTLTSCLSELNIPIRSWGEANQNYIFHHQTETPNINTPNYKCGYHISWDNKKYWYRSSYEQQYMKILDYAKVTYEFEKLRIKYYDTQEKRERISVPDFYLPKFNTIVEVKSSYTLDETNMRDRSIRYAELGYFFLLLLDGKYN